MASPFPGMDPYLEHFWRDVHTRLITYACDQLQPQLPGQLRARLEERVFVDSPDTEEFSVYPDVRVVERGRKTTASLKKEPVLAVAEPLIIDIGEEPITEAFVEIIDIGSGKRVVTVLELLSMANKRPGEGQEAYLKKQRQCLRGKVSLVEIDLLRAGQRVLALPQRRIRASHRTTYQICVVRGWIPSKAEVYAAPLRAPLPRIKIPLRKNDQDAVLDLQKLLEQCYRNGGYDDDIDYRIEPEPPLDRTDATWADKLLRKQKRR